MLGPAASFAVGMTRKNWLWQGKRMTDWTRRLQLIPLIASNAFSIYDCGKLIFCLNRKKVSETDLIDT
jgi:hypothetical protein